METQKITAPRSPQINIKLTAEERELFDKLSKARGLKLSALARSLMHDEARRLGLK